VSVPRLTARGGSGSFTISIAEAVTLVPLCGSQPYVIRTVPRNEPDTVFSPGTDIVIYFNGPLDESSVGFGTGAIEIRAKDLETGGDGEDYYADYYDIAREEYFLDPVYASRQGFYTITINPVNIPWHHRIKVKVGSDVKSSQGEGLAEDVWFSWSTPRSTSARIDTWGAVYDGSANTITVTCTTTGAPVIKARYSVNQGLEIELAVSETAQDSGSWIGTISGVGRIDASGVLDGRQVSGIREYGITLECYVDHVIATVPARFKIWNIPGMSVGWDGITDDSAVEIHTAAGLAAIPENATRQYVLANDISVLSHAPIADFRGKFYGNGHTVTVKELNPAADMGLFGAMLGSIARDLTVAYETAPATRSAVTRFGGIAGTTTGATRIENVVVKGESGLTVDTDNHMYAGGIAGLMSGTSGIFNSYCGLNLTVNHPTAAASTMGSSVYVGGIVGNMGSTGGAAVRVEDVVMVGDINVTASSNDEGNSTGGLFVGGIAGFAFGTNALQRAILNNAHYQQGTITVTSGTGSAYIGGAIGRSHRNIDITNSSAIAGGFDIYKAGNGSQFFAGGFVGDAGGGVNSAAYNGTVGKCFSENHIAVNTSSGVISTLVVGGFSGRLTPFISYCYAKGNVSALCYAGIYAGGFSGNMTAGSNCYATGNVNVIFQDPSAYLATAIMYAGGFTGSFSGDVSDCYALGDVFADKSGQLSTIFAGGFAGNQTGSLARCFTAGSVIAQRGDIYIINAGGLVGGKSGNLEMRDSAVLGNSVTATGSGTKNVGRVYSNNTGAAAAIANNRAYNDMKLYTSNTYGAPSMSMTPVAGTSSHGGPDGLNAHFGNFRLRTFWKNAPPPDGTAPGAAHGLGFSETVTIDGTTYPAWDFVTVESRGYPILRGPDGRLMGGQQ